MREHEAMAAAHEGERLYADGRYAAALDAFERSVEAMRVLVSQQAFEYVPQLAGQLHNIALCLSKLGRPEDAVNRLEVAIDLLGQHMDAIAGAAGDPVIRHLLATTSQSLAAQLTDLHRYDEAVAVADRAILLKRAQLQPDVLQVDPSLGVALRVRAQAGARAGGDLEKAEAAATEAAHIFGELAERDPAQFHVEMCRTYDVLAGVLERRGRRGDAAQLREWLGGQVY